MDDGDIFAEVLSLEESAFQQGFAEGRLHATQEARRQGEEAGQQLGEELGFYEGFSSLSADVPPRAQQTLERLKAILASLRTETEPWTSELVQEARAQFRAVCAMLKLTHAVPASQELF